MNKYDVEIRQYGRWLHLNSFTSLKKARELKKVYRTSTYPTRILKWSSEVVS